MPKVDATNSCIPRTSPLLHLGCPAPSTIRGEPCVIDGSYRKDRALLVYGSGRLVVVRRLDESEGNNGDGKINPHEKHLVYRGHSAPVTAVRFSPSGSYIASGDAKGRVRVWAYDHPDHWCQWEGMVLTGPIRDIAWDFESKRLVIVGERAETASGAECCRALQWDTGVTCGVLGQHTRGRATSCACRPCRPMRVVTSGKDDSLVLANEGPPFRRIVDGTPTDDAHSKGGAVHCVRYNPDGTRVASVGADKSVCLYDGKSLSLLEKLENAHDGTIYSCSWSTDGKSILTCGADGTCKVLAVEPKLAVTKTWAAFEAQVGPKTSEDTTTQKVPIGGMQMGCAFCFNDLAVSVSLNGQISLLDEDGEGHGSGHGVRSVLTGHGAAIAGMTATPAEGIAYTGDTDGVVVEWDLATGTAVRRLHSGTAPARNGDANGSSDLLHKTHGGAAISCVATAHSKDGARLLLTAGWDDKVRIFHQPSPSSSSSSSTPSSMPPVVFSLEAQPCAMACGTRLAAILTVGGVVLVDCHAMTASPLVPLSNYAGLSVCVSRDDSTVYVGGDDCKIHVHRVSSDWSSLEEDHVIENGHLKPVHALRLSHDETKLASADIRDVCVWDAARDGDAPYAPIISKGRWCFHMQRITCLAWSSDDQVLASAGADDSIYLWSLSKKTKRIHYPFSHRGGITGLEFLDSWKMVTAGVDACVNQWDVSDDVAKKFG